MSTSPSTITIAVVHPITRRIFRHRGNSPTAVGLPGQQEPPIVIDMATSAETLGKVRMARRNGNRIPPGWAIDAKDGGAKARTVPVTESRGKFFLTNSPALMLLL